MKIGFLDIDAEPRIPAGHRGYEVVNRRLLANLVAADRCLADWFQNIDALNDPAHLRLPQHRFENATGGGRRHHIVGEALNLHLGTRKAGSLAPGAEGNGLRFIRRQAAHHASFRSPRQTIKSSILGPPSWSKSRPTSERYSSSLVSTVT